MDNDNDKTQSFVPLTKGTEIGHYKIVEKIGAGGMGEVYLAEDTELNRKVALKFLPLHLCQDENCRTRFKREAQAAAKLNHPNIVTIHEVSEYKFRPYIVMEHILGESLRDMLKEHAVTVEKAIKITLDLCEGLNKAHQEGITHRDIKPSNIIIDSEGRAKLLDFGLATIKGDEKLTKTGSTLGTIGYMSPEQVKGKDVDHRSDLFSVGVALYEMIAGRRPFEGEGEAAILNSILNTTPEPLARYKSNIPDELQQVVTKLLEKNPELRYQSAAGIISDLKRLSADRDIPAEKPKDWWNRYVVAGAVVVLLIMAGVWLYDKFIAKPTQPIEPDRKMLAVLPFENIGQPGDEYFADGITEEITSHLAKLTGLGVVSRTSVVKYKDSKIGLPEIGKELGVDYILEGTVRWDRLADTSRIRITSQLIKVSDNTHLWAENYERPLTQIFSVQKDIAKQISEVLNIKLIEPKQETVKANLTDNIDAYQAYMRGLGCMAGPDKDEGKAVQMFERAVEFDPEFVLAYAELAKAYACYHDTYTRSYDTTEDYLTKSRAAVDRVLELQPELPEAHIALGYYYYRGLRDHNKALAEFTLAEKDLPNDTRILRAKSYIWARQGKFEDGLKNMKGALEFSPRDAGLLYELAELSLIMRKYSKAMYYYDRSIALSPNQGASYTGKARAYRLWQGDLDKARSILEGTVHEYSSPWIEQRLLERDYQAVLDIFAFIRNLLENDAQRAWVSQASGEIYERLGRPDIARSYYDSARVYYEGIIKLKSDNDIFRALLSRVYAGLGLKKDAIREGNVAMELCPVSKDAVAGPAILEYLAMSYLTIGENDKAIDNIEYLLSVPYTISVPLLRIDPAWDPLRDHPRFQALLEKYQ